MRFVGNIEEALEKAAEEEMKSLESIEIDDVVEKSLEQEAEEEMQSLWQNWKKGREIQGILDTVSK